MSTYVRACLAGVILLATALSVRADDLSDAIAKSDVARVRKLLADNPKLATTPRDKHQPLHPAVWHGNVEIVKLLLDAGADVNARAEFWEAGLTPLHLAANYRQHEIAELLIARGADLKARTKSDGFTPLYHAVMRDASDLVALLLAKGADPDGGWDSNNLEPTKTPLYWAARDGYIDVARLLLAKGAKLNHPKLIGRDAPLWWAVENRHKVIVRLLLARGADPNTKHVFAFTLSTGQRDLVDLFLAKKVDASKVEHLIAAVYSGKKDLVELTLDKGADVNGVYQGDIALLVAARKHDAPIMSLLLARGAAAQVADGDGTTPLHLAPDKAVAELLLAKGAKINARDQEGRNPLFFAVQRGDLQLAEFLETNGAEHDVSTLAALGRVKKDASVLQRAAFHGHREVVAFLLDKGADVDGFAANGYDLHGAAFRTQVSILAYFAQKDKTKFKGLEPIVKIRKINGKEPVGIVGGTPLQAAVAGEQRAVVELLLARGAKVDGRFPDGSTPLHLAAALGDMDVVRLLLAGRADVNARNQAGLTPLGVALSRDETAVAALLRQKARE